jgi:hypothetical protein
MASRVVEVGTDSRGLGRYAWTKFQGRNGHTARLISVYVPCFTSRSSGDLTVINQQRRYCDAHALSTCPRQLLLEDLRSLLLTWRQAGERLVVFLDANENMLNGPFQSMLASPDLQMREATYHKHPNPRWPQTATYYKGTSIGKFPIDGVWVTPDLPVDAATWLQFLPHLGDHRFNILDINAQTLVGDNLIKIVRPPARRLNSKLPQVEASYISHLLAHMCRHRVLSKLHQLYVARDGAFTPAQRETLERLDRVRADGMRYAEKKCRKLSMGMVDFSPEVDQARKRRWIWKQVVKLREGKQVGTYLIKRKARQCGISCPLSVTLAQAKENFRLADEAYDKLKQEAPLLRQEFLRDVATNRSGSASTASQTAAKRLLQQERQ